MFLSHGCLFTLFISLAMYLCEFGFCSRKVFDLAYFWIGRDFFGIDGWLKIPLLFHFRIAKNHFDFRASIGSFILVSDDQFFAISDLLLIVLFLVEVFLSMGSHLRRIPGLYLGRYFLPIIPKALYGWVKVSLPSRKSSCSSGVHLPSLTLLSWPRLERGSSDYIWSVWSNYIIWTGCSDKKTKILSSEKLIFIFQRPKLTNQAQEKLTSLIVVLFIILFLTLI